MQDKNIVIRREEEKDRRAVEHLVRESFWNVYRPGCYEHFVLHKLRSDPAFVQELDLVMEKDGQRQEFTLENYPDSTWTFIDSRTVLVGGNDAQPEIHDFSITTIDGGQRDITQEFLADTAFKFLLVSPYIEQADEGVMDRVATIHDYCLAHGYSFLCLTSSSEEAIARWQDMTGAEYPFCHTDAIALKTMVRSNPGLLLLKGSRVVNKWPSSAFPREEMLSAPLDNGAIAGTSNLPPAAFSPSARSVQRPSNSEASLKQNRFRSTRSAPRSPLPSPRSTIRFW